MPTKETHTVLQFHYTKWPDYGTPKLAAPLLNFLRAVHASNPPGVGPIVVHCSAGVGRSGTVICIDYCLAQLRTDSVIDVRGFVSRMRENRNYMVQTEVCDSCLILKSFHWFISHKSLFAYLPLSLSIYIYIYLPPSLPPLSHTHRPSMPSSTMPSWRPSPTATPPSLSQTSPIVTSSCSRRTRSQVRLCWRRSLPDWGLSRP